MTEQEQLDYNQRIIDRCDTPGHFGALLGLTCDRLDRDGAEGHFTVTRQLCNPLGIVHGGVYFTLMDQLAGMAAAATGRAGVTLDCSVNYLKSARMGDRVRCTVESVHLGRSVAVYDAKCWGEDGTLLCTGTFHLFFVRPLEEMLDGMT